MSDLRRYFGEKWDADGGTENLYYAPHDLVHTSTVFDVGGYQGEWSQKIAELYDPHIYIFEPVREFYDSIEKKFRHNGKVHPRLYGLASADGYLPITIAGAASSGYEPRIYGERRVVEFRDAARDAVELLGKEAIGDIEIDLMAINIEGGEYDLLPHMINTGLAFRCRKIMIQFHMLWPACYDLWKNIRKDLNQTHELKWDYPFVWEKWVRR